MKRIAIIADDLTGANDTGIKFRQNGYQTMVILESNKFGVIDKDKSVWAINTDTRDLSVGEAYQIIFNLAERLYTLKDFRVYKKIDSTLRGHPGAELEAVMDAWQASLAIVVPSFPANRRVVKYGYLMVGDFTGEELNEAEVEKAASCFVPDVMQKEMRRKVGMIQLEDVRQGVNKLLGKIDIVRKNYEVLVIDALNDKDLEIIARAIAQLSPDTIITGSAGLADPLSVVWAQYITPLFPGEGILIFAAGSHNPTTAVQVKEIIRYTGQEAIVVQTQEIVKGNSDSEIERVIRLVNQRTGKEQLIILAIDTLFQSEGLIDEHSGKLIASAFGRIIRNILPGLRIKGLVMTGGDIALHICQALGASGINLFSELNQGIPFGYLAGYGDGNLPVVTKAGGFGTPQVFIDVYNFFNQSGK